MSHVRSEKYCAKCMHFTGKDLPTSTPAGRGRCTMFEKIVTWDEHFCVIFTIAKNMSVRQKWIAQQSPTEGESNGKPT